MDQKIENIIINYLNRSSSAGELHQLTEWLADAKNEKVFDDYVKAHFRMTMAVNEADVDALKASLQKEMSAKGRVVQLPLPKSKYGWAAAAVVAFFLVTPIFFDKSEDSATTPIGVVDNQIQPGTDKAVLTLADGEDVNLGKGKTYVGANANSQGEHLIYKNGVSDNGTNEMAYNYLTIPRGGEFFVQLSDGTQIWLNSESRLKYPVAFAEGQVREVELLYGEAYFDVSPSTAHKGSRFKVLHNTQQIEVLGTEFNLKAYYDEPTVETTLVEGAVAIQSQETNEQMVPNQQYVYHLVSGRGQMNSNVNVYNVTSWRKGVFIFQNKSLDEVCRLLARWYDVDFTINNQDLKKIVLSGSVSKEQNIESILLTIKNLKGIEYEIQGSNIIIE